MRCALPIVLGICASVSARCGTKPHADIGAMHVAYQAHEAALAGQPARRQDVDYLIDVYFHVITENDTVAGGHLSEETIDKQVAVLNDRYSGSGFSFINVNTTYIPEPKWRNILEGSDTEYEMKSTLRQGSYSDLNIYVDSLAEGPAGQALAYATLPNKPSEKGFNSDGVVIDPDTFPDVLKNPPWPFNQGITLVHEVGHWLSLLHTFEPSPPDSTDPLAGCYGDGDYIFDTPAEGSAGVGCEKGRDTCTGSVEASNNSSMPGVDPIHNYMDYGDDGCLNRFSKGQIQRMQTAFEQSRINYEPGDGGEVIDPEPGRGPE